MAETRTRLHELMDLFIEAREHGDQVAMRRLMYEIDVETATRLAQKRRLPRELDPLLQKAK